MYTELYEELSLTKQHSLSFSLSSFFVITWYAVMLLWWLWCFLRDSYHLAAFLD